MTFETAIDARTLYEEALCADPAVKPKFFALAINWDAADDNAETWWQAFYECLAAGTTPVELRLLEDREISEPMTKQRQRAVILWCESLPGWDHRLRALTAVSVKICEACKGDGFTRQDEDSEEPEEEVRRPGRYERCEACDGNGVIV